jgi:uncharacterized repeat protein (TIGR03803 family)
LTPSGTNWSETLLIDFPDLAAGEEPAANLVADSSGAIYGTTAGGGAAGFGTIFELAPVDKWGIRPTGIIYQFAGGTTDGAQPFGQLAVTAGDVIYGSTTEGGANGTGTVFRLKP